jgi:sugar lactone lactonase YvrE
MFSQGPPGPAYWRIRQEAAKKVQQHDYQSALGPLLEADRLVPQNPHTILYLAEAYCQLNQPQAAMDQLRRLVRMRVFFDLASEPAFAHLNNSAEFRQLVSQMKKIRTTKVVRAKTAFRVADPTFLPEGIAYDSKTGSFFLSSIHHRKIIRLDSHGKYSDFITEGQDDLWSVSGIGADSTRRTMWACSNRFDGAEGFTTGMPKLAMLYAFDLDTGKLKRQYPIQKPGDDHFCDGVVVSPDGTVLVADSAGLAIYQVADGDQEPRILVAPEAGISPQGLALSQDGKTLFVSNYLSGLYAINLPSSKIKVVREHAQDSLAGIDGLVAYGKNLVAIQNGIQPNRVVMLEMSDDGMTVEAVKTLEVNHPLFGEPTLGVVVNDSLFFVANNRIEQFLSQRSFAGFPDPVVLKRDLK